MSEETYRILPSQWIKGCSQCRFTNNPKTTCIHKDNGQNGMSRLIPAMTKFPHWCPLEKVDE